MSREINTEQSVAARSPLPTRPSVPENVMPLVRTFALVVLLSIAHPVIAADTERPNILFCFADDWGRYASAYAALDAKPSANSVVKTPNIDSVAARGVLFRNAFVPAPSCTPCRSSLLSGRYFFNTGRGAILQGAVWDESIPAFPLLLRDAGYHIGKRRRCGAPARRPTPRIGGQQYAYQKAGMGFNNFSEQVTQAVKGGKTVAQARAELLAQVEGNFAAFLKARDAKKPFFFWFGPTTVHRTWIKGSGKALWGIDPDALKGKLPKFLPDVPEVREDFADYLGEAQAFDAYVGVLLKQLEDAGELDRTLVVVSGDHGAPGFPGGKCNLYDFGTGVALVAAGPGVQGRRVVDDFVNLMDLAPTFLEVGGVKPPAGLNGKSLWPVLTSEKAGQVDPDRTWVVTGRERHVGDAREGNLPYPQRALRTKDFLYVRNFAPDRYPMGDPKGVTADKAPDANALENEHVRRVRRHGRQPDEGVARRPPQRPEVEVALRLRLRQAAGGGAVRPPHRPGPGEERRRRQGVRGDAEEARRAVDEDPDRRRRPAAGREGLPVREAAVHRRRRRARSEPDTETAVYRLVLSLLAVGLLAPAASAEPIKRPNIVWIVVDDMSANFSCYGEKLIQTPHVDRLAAEGTRFSKAFVTAPVCSPCRSALITGCYQTTIGAHHHRSGRGELKIHLPGDVVPVPGAVPEGRLLHLHRRVRRDGRRARQDRLQLRVGPRRCTTATTGPGASRASRSSCRCSSTAGSTAGRGRTRTGRTACAKELGSNTKPEDVTLPPYYPRDPVILQDWADYLDCCRYTDKEVGDVIARLEKEKLLDDTVVFFMTDHGISHARGKQFLYDEGTHVPFVVRGPGDREGRRPRRPDRAHRPGRHLARAGRDRGPEVDAGPERAGEGLREARRRVRRPRPLRRDDGAHPQRPHGAVQVHPQLPATSARTSSRTATRTTRPSCRSSASCTRRRSSTSCTEKLLFAEKRPAEELYDLAADPHEVTNLAADPKHKADARRDAEAARGLGGARPATRAASPSRWRCTTRT